LTSVAVVHDYLTQRGGAERLVLSMLKAFPAAPLYTSLYLPDATFPDFRWADVRPLPLDRIAFLRRHHRLALPLLAPAFSRLTVTADVVLCSSSGWAHGARALGRKLVYCHTPARWLYQTQTYLGRRRPMAAAALHLLDHQLREWDRKAARSADRYLTQSTAVRDRIRQLYGIDAEVIPGPYRLGPAHSQMPIEGLTAGFFLCVSRLLPYKNVDAVISAFADLPRAHLVVAGTGPQAAALKRLATRNVRLVGSVSDEQLAWLYANCAGVIAAAYEDYGLTPLEAAAFGKPAAVLRWGGFLDTVVEGETGAFFDSPTPADVRSGVARLRAGAFHASRIQKHANAYSEERFISRLRATALLGETGAIMNPGRTA
jgi:glycosyltransferase involved in cell wall biosynthesis